MCALETPSSDQLKRCWDTKQNVSLKYFSDSHTHTHTGSFWLPCYDLLDGPPLLVSTSDLPRNQATTLSPGPKSCNCIDFLQLLKDLLQLPSAPEASSPSPPDPCTCCSFTWNSLSGFITTTYHMQVSESHILRESHSDHPI